MNATLATIIAILFITVITISGELLPPIKDWLKQTLFHHWVGKGVLGLLLWVLIAPLPIKYKPTSRTVLLILIGSVSAIFLFYILHYLML